MVLVNQGRILLVKLQAVTCGHPLNERNLFLLWRSSSKLQPLLQPSLSLFPGRSRQRSPSQSPSASPASSSFAQGALSVAQNGTARELCLLRPIISSRGDISGKNTCSAPTDARTAQKLPDADQKLRRTGFSMADPFSCFLSGSTIWSLQRSGMTSS